MRHTMIVAPLVLVILAACPSVDNARFTGASNKQLVRTFTASSGIDIRTAAAIGFAISGRNEPARCPRIETHGNVTTASGPCKLASGTWDGTVTAENVPSSGSIENPAFDPDKPGTVRFDNLSITNSGGTGTIDGFVTVDMTARTIDADLTIDDDDVATNAVLHQACDDDDFCTASSSTVEISGLGSAKVEGAWQVATPAKGQLTVRGAQTLVFDFTATTPAGCVPFKIDGGSPGQVCDSSSSELNVVAAPASVLEDIEQRVR